MSDPHLVASPAPDPETSKPKLRRYGLQWEVQDGPVLIEMADGYWTPWHVADLLLAAYRDELASRAASSPPPSPAPDPETPLLVLARYVSGHGPCHSEYCGDDPKIDDYDGRQRYIREHRNVCDCGAEDAYEVSRRIIAAASSPPPSQVPWQAIRHAIAMIVESRHVGGEAQERLLRAVEDELDALASHPPSPVPQIPDWLGRLWSASASASGYLQAKNPEMAARLWQCLQDAMAACGVASPVFVAPDDKRTKRMHWLVAETKRCLDTEGRLLAAYEMLDALDALIRLASAPPSLRPNRFDCPTCGSGIGVDEDWCCRTCGADATVVVNGLPASPPPPSPVLDTRARETPERPASLCLIDPDGSGSAQWMDFQEPEASPPPSATSQLTSIRAALAVHPATPVENHWPGCEMYHWACGVRVLLAEIDRLAALSATPPPWPPEKEKL